MSHEDADPEEDDLSLQSMRSLWRSMPDDEPPAGGLAELMAAARVKADEMKAAQAAPAPVIAAVSSPVRAHEVEPERVSWWQRLVALLQRPPVLALATVTILIGGVVILGQREEQLDATPQVAQEAAAVETDKRVDPSENQPSPVVGGLAAPTEAAGSGMATGTVVAEPAPDESAPMADRVTPGGALDSSSVPARDELRRPAKAKKASTSMSTVTTSKSPGVTSSKQKSGARALELDGARAEDVTRMSDTDDGKVDRGGEVQQAPSPEAAASAVSTRGEPSVAQLHARARTTASRGDCTTARTLLQQIARQDAAYYRAKVASDPTLASCLAK